MSVTGQPDSVAEKSIFAQLARINDSLNRSVGMAGGIRVRVNETEVKTGQSSPPEHAPPKDTIADRTKIAEGQAEAIEARLVTICDRLG